MSMQSEEYLRCPYCGETISMLVDHTLPEQRYVEDCEVCCRPIDIECRVDASGTLTLRAQRGDD